MEERDKQIIFMIVFIILGIIVSVQFRTTGNEKKQKDSIISKVEKLKIELKSEKELGLNLQKNIDKNVIMQDEYMKSFVNNKNDIELKKKWESIKIKAGLTEVKGEGIVIILNDSTLKTNENIMLSIIHDSDLLVILNELKKAGSQAIAVNGERVIAKSEQICNGPTIRINKKRYPAPFEIKAIGDPTILYNSINFSNIAENMRKSGITIDVNKEKDIIISKFIGNVRDEISGLEVLEQ